ncbi:MAG: PQQ-dependent sugar dehydrogenase [Adhaeribacter sp.]
MKYFFQFCLGAGLLLAGCNQKYAGSGTAKNEVPPLQTPIEGEMMLDSTRIGVSTVASNLNVAWEIAWGPDNWIWFTEQSGTVSRVNPATGEKKTLLTIKEVWRQRSTGLLGMALHPNMKKFPFVYVDYTTRQGTKVTTKLVRYTYAGDSLSKPLTLLEIPGSTGHNGSRVATSPDGKLFWATGDAIDLKNAQDPNSLNGKVLRLNLDGSVPQDNPTPGSLVWTRGYRNMQGMAFGARGQLYTSEHGDANDDEVNLTWPGRNYGYPAVTGFCDTPKEKAFCEAHQVVEPLKAWTPVIAPAGIDYYASAAIPEWRNALLLGTLKEADLRVLKLDASGEAIVSEQIFFDKVFGRLRDICVSPAGDIYLSTSNRDWNPGPGFPKQEDDRIIRIFPIKPGDQHLVADASRRLQLEPAPETESPGTSEVKAGAALYTQYCSACHKADGSGVAGTFPPLRGAEQVLGPKPDLIRIALKGLSGPIKVKGQTYDQQMPAFAFLSDQDLSQVLSYIRSEFGNQASAINAQEVSQVRASEK